MIRPGDILLKVHWINGNWAGYNQVKGCIIYDDPREIYHFVPNETVVKLENENEKMKEFLRTVQEDASYHAANLLEELANADKPKKEPQDDDA